MNHAKDESNFSARLPNLESLHYDLTDLKKNREDASSVRVIKRHDRSKTDIMRNLESQDINSQFLLELSKLTHQKGSTKQLQRLYNQKILNAEARKKAYVESRNDTVTYYNYYTIIVLLIISLFII